MSLDNPTGKEAEYLEKAGGHACAQILAGVLILAIFVVIGVKFLPLAIYTGVVSALALLPLFNISLILASWILGPGPTCPASLEKEL